MHVLRSFKNQFPFLSQIKSYYRFIFCVLALPFFMTLLMTFNFASASLDSELSPSDDGDQVTSENTDVQQKQTTISKYFLKEDEVQHYFQGKRTPLTTIHLNQVNTLIDATLLQLSKQTNVTEFSVYAKDLKSNVTYSWHAERLAETQTFHHTEAYYKGASVAKLYEVFAVYKLAEAGFVNLDQLIKDPYTGVVFTLREATAKAIRKSDNNSFCRILRAIGPKAINAVLKQYGIDNNYIYAELGPAEGFSVKNNLLRYGTEKSSRVNPYGAGIILERVYRETLAGNAYMKDLNRHLLNNVYTSRIPAALSYKLAVAHKTGTIESEGVYHDAGIVYGTHPYVVVVYTKNAPDKIKAHVFIRGAVKSINTLFKKERLAMDKASLKQSRPLPSKPKSPPDVSSDETLDPSLLPDDSAVSDAPDDPSVLPENSPDDTLQDDTLSTP